MTYFDNIFNFFTAAVFHSSLFITLPKCLCEKILKLSIYTYIGMLIFLTALYCQETVTAGSKQEISISKKWKVILK